MSKNVKRIFFAVTLLTLLVAVSAVSASDISDDTPIADAVQDNVVSDTPQVASSDALVTEEVQTTSTDEKSVETNNKKIEKEDKNLKEDSITIDGIEYSNIIENQEINGEGDIDLVNVYINNSTFNNEEIQLCFYAEPSYINNSIINSVLYTDSGRIKITNSFLNNLFYNWGAEVIIDDSVTFGENFNLYNDDNDFNCEGTIYTNNSLLIGKLQEINCDFETIPQDFSGSVEIIGETISHKIDVPTTGNLTLINCTLENINAYNVINNRGTITMINCTIRNCSLTQADGALIANNGNLILKDTVIDANIINITSGTVYGFIHNYYGSNIATLTMDNVTFSNNQIISTPRGSSSIFGFVNCFSKMNLVSLNNSVFTNNYVYAKNGDDIDYNAYLFYGVTDSIVSDCTFENNVASAISGSNVNLTNTTFKNNSRTINSRNSANALVVLSGENIVSGCEFSSNFLYMNNGQSYSGNPHGALYVEKAVVSNSVFDNNGIECNSIWLSVNGAAISGRDLTITNNNFTNNYINTVKGTSASTETYEFDFSSSGYGVDICADGTTTITGNNFINSTGNQDVGSIYSSDEQSVIEITNNNFTNCKANKETIAVITENKNIADNTFTNCSIGFKSLNLTAPNKIYSNEDITVSLEIELAYPENYDSDILEKTDYEWYINGETTTDKDTSKTISVGTSNIIVYVTPTVSNNRTRVLAIAPTILNDIIITPDNINNYVFDGELIASPNSRLIFQGEFNNLGEIYNNKNQVFFEGSNATFTNTSFKIEANDNTIQNMNINNTDTSEYIIINIGNNNIIQNNTLTQYNSNGKTAAIYSLNSQNTLITNNKINVKGPSVAIQYGETAAIANTQAILDESGTNNQITYNTITVANSTDAELDAFGTIEAITAPKGTNNTISYNTIECTGARFNYGINTLDNVLENTITYNNITVTGYRYTDGIQVGNGANNNYIANNNINLTCLNDTPVDEAAISYGIIVTSQGGLTSDNNTVTQNNILINGAVNYGMEIYTATNTLITENNITLNGVKSMGIGYAHSPNSTVKDNIITINDNTLLPLNGVTEEIQPESVGIKIQQDSDNILIEDNIITTKDIAKTDKTVDVEALNATIQNNKLTSSTGYGEDTITTTMTDTTIENNIIETMTTTEDVTALKNTPITLTATVTDEFENNVNGGSVTFTDADGNTIATAEVIDGTATTTATFTTTGESTITATYTPTSTGLATSTAEASLVIKDKFQTTITIDEITATAGQTTTITANVQDENGDAVTAGKVTFKVNGKTLKDENGKVIYAKVVDGVATATYDVPLTMAGKDINITAVYTGSSKYDKQTVTTTTTVQKATPTLTITPFNEPVTSGSTVTLKAKVALGETPITTGKIVFKINGKTVKDANGKVIYAKVDANGEVSVDYNLGDLKANTYTVEAVFTATGYDKLTSNTTMTVVKA